MSCIGNVLAEAPPATPPVATRLRRVVHKGNLVKIVCFGDVKFRKSWRGKIFCFHKSADLAFYPPTHNDSEAGGVA